MANDKDQVDKNAFLFLSVREKTDINAKLAKIASCLNEGADVNAADANDYNNTPLHMAVIRAEIDVIRLLIERGATLHVRNVNGKLPSAIAKTLTNDKKQDILDIFRAASKKTNETRVQIHGSTLQNGTTKNLITKKSKKPYFYLKRTGTAGILGKFYETKLLSLVLLRALNDNDIEEFYLGTNVDKIGDLDDICLRYKVKGHPKPIVIFLQAKHREDQEKGRITDEDLKNVYGDYSLRRYIDSYMKIISRFQPKNEDNMFGGQFSSVECNLIIYTPARGLFTKKSTCRKTSLKVHDLINTGKETEAFQFNYNDNDLIYLSKMTVEKRLSELGVEFLHLIMGKNKLQVIMASELIARYHVVMRREVMEPVRETEEYRAWKFRSHLFRPGSDYLDVLRKTFYHELSKSVYDKSDIDTEDCINLRSMLNEPCAYTISKLISKLVIYDGKKLQLQKINNFKELFPENDVEILKADLNEIKVTEDVVHEAIKIKLELLEFKLPLAFGNLDMSLRGDDKKVQSTITRVVDKLKPLFKKDEKTIEINDDIVGPNKLIEDGIIKILSSAVGNLLVFDINSRLLMFNTEDTALPVNAKLLLDEFKKYFTNEELSSYRINIIRNKFPKDSFQGDEYDKKQATKFLNKLWFYTDQAQEDKVEDILKNEINIHYYSKKSRSEFAFIIRSDAIYLKSHNDVQQWWLEPGKARYLTRSDDFFEKAKEDVIDNPLLTILNFMYTLKIRNIEIKFKSKSVQDLELHTISERLFNVVTKASLLSSTKIMQHFEEQDQLCTFVDFDYVLSLPLTDFKKMLKELEQTDKSHTLIIVYERLKKNEGFCSLLRQVTVQFKGSNIVIVTDSDVADEIKSNDCFKDQYQSMRDDITLTNLTDLDESSQNKILNRMGIIFQGETVPIRRVLAVQARGLVRGNILNEIINNHKIEIGRSLIDKAYNDVKESYIDRILSRGADMFKVKSLNDDFTDNVVVVSGRPGTGKSILLTYLSLQTKIDHPLPWIVRVNLTDYEKDFSRWQERNITVDLHWALHFLCKVALKNFDTQTKLVLSQQDNEIIVLEVDTTINSDALFELELFLNLYNLGSVVFLFDGFNAMCPHRELVLNILKLLRDEGKRIWITTDEYWHARTALINDFGVPYNIDQLQTKTKILTERIFKDNAVSVNRVQCENIFLIMEYLVGDPHGEPNLSSEHIISNLMEVLAFNFLSDFEQSIEQHFLEAQIRFVYYHRQKMCDLSYIKVRDLAIQLQGLIDSFAVQLPVLLQRIQDLIHETKNLELCRYFRKLLESVSKRFLAICLKIFDWLDVIGNDNYIPIKSEIISSISHCKHEIKLSMNDFVFEGTFKMHSDEESIGCDRSCYFNTKGTFELRTDWHIHIPNKTWVYRHPMYIMAPLYHIPLKLLPSGVVFKRRHKGNLTDNNIEYKLYILVLNVLTPYIMF